MTRQWSLKPGVSPCVRGAAIILCGALWLATGLTAAAQGSYESPPVLQASAILAREVVAGPNHRVEERVVNDGYINTYTINSKFGRFTAVSTAGLHVRINEINALVKMETVKGSKEYEKSVKEAGGDVVQGIKSLATQPVDTVSGAVSGVGRMFQRAGESLWGSARSEAEGSRWKDLIGFAKTKREYAQLFGVDVTPGAMLGYLPVVFFGAATPGPMRAVAILLWVTLFPERPAEMTAFGLVQHNFFIFFNAAIGLLFLKRANRELFGP